MDIYKMNLVPPYPPEMETARFSMTTFIEDMAGQTMCEVRDAEGLVFAIMPPEQFDRQFTVV